MNIYDVHNAKMYNTIASGVRLFCIGCYCCARDTTLVHRFFLFFLVFALVRNQAQIDVAILLHHRVLFLCEGINVFERHFTFAFLPRFGVVGVQKLTPPVVVFRIGDVRGIGSHSVRAVTIKQLIYYI